MADAFDSYIKKLSELEQADNRAALFSFCSLNEPLLSFFKGIWEPLQTILHSSNISPDVLSEVKGILPQLNAIKERYESLLKTSGINQDLVIKFKKQIDSITTTNYASVGIRLEELEKHIRTSQSQSLERERKEIDSAYWQNNKNRILSGNFSASKDVALAEEHMSEGSSATFYLNLITYTNNAIILGNIYIAAKKLQIEERYAVMLKLINKGIPFDKKDDAVLDIIYNANSTQKLDSVKGYCITAKQKEMLNAKYRVLSHIKIVSKQPGCLAFIIILVIVGSIFII